MESRFKLIVGEQVVEGLTGLQASHVRAKQLPKAMFEVGTFRGAGDVRGQDDVGHLPQRVIRGQGIVKVRVERSAGDLPGLERPAQVRFTDQSSSGRVEQECTIG